MGLSIIILAAGRGSRMKSSLPKVLHKIAGKELINHVRDTALELLPKEVIITISHEAENVRTTSFIENVKYAYQKQQLGTGDAVKSAMNEVSNSSNYVLILYGDTPLIKASTLQELYSETVKSQSLITLFGFNTSNPSGYGRLVTKDNIVERIVESKDATPEELNINICNSGIMLVETNLLRKLLSQITNTNAQGEYYLTDIVKLAKDQNINSFYFLIDEAEVQGVNSRYQLSIAENIYQERLRNKFMDEGVTLIDPKTVTFSYDTIIANDVTIYPHVVFGKKVTIETNVEIKSFSHIEGAYIKSNTIIGPFARIRPDTTIEENAVIGNFVEIKNSNIGTATKINHLSYIGDTDIGIKSNIGAGVITCNYDGFKKSKTIIGDEVFVGSNSALLAPLTIESNSIIAAGSIINKDIPQNSIAISRADLKILKDKANNFRSKNLKKNE
ncbi:MAG: bifunctional UDP-N-acetylglucosamine diphosphorylase/glucosamine-1-phosphate N-acetyltransferase GlmU [Alphaproteobacteria bacterium]